MVDYLRTPPNAQQSQLQYIKSLHQILVQRYYEQCHGKWYQCKNDGYFYKNFCSHAIAAEADQILEALMTDFNLIALKLKFFGSFNNIYHDLKSVSDYLRAKEEVGYEKVFVRRHVYKLKSL